jgi:hypothetical protein
VDTPDPTGFLTTLKLFLAALALFAGLWLMIDSTH